MIFQEFQKFPDKKNNNIQDYFFSENKLTFGNKIYGHKCEQVTFSSSL
jgi:hypothetical protein